jgi:anti-sigma B factor antagonist
MSTPPSVVEVSGEVDMATAPELRARLLDAIAEGDGVIVVDLAQVDFMDSSGFAVLVTASQRLRSGGRDLVVRGARAAVLSAMRMTRLDMVLTIEEASVAETET